MNRLRANQRGLTFVELLMTLAVAAILVGVAVPGFATFIERNRSVTATNEFLAGLLLTRSEAIRRDRPAIICPSSNGTSCGGTLWHVGWIGCEDTDNNSDCDNDEEIFMVAEELPPGVTITTADAAIASSYRFAPTGRPRNAGLPTGTWDINVNGDYQRHITVSSTGRARAYEP